MLSVCDFLRQGSLVCVPAVCGGAKDVQTTVIRNDSAVARTQMQEETMLAPGPSVDIDCASRRRTRSRGDSSRNGALFHAPGLRL